MLAAFRILGSNTAFLMVHLDTAIFFAATLLGNFCHGAFISLRAYVTKERKVQRFCDKIHQATFLSVLLSPWQHLPGDIYRKKNVALREMLCCKCCWATLPWQILSCLNAPLDLLKTVEVILGKWKDNFINCCLYCMTYNQEVML